MKKLSILLILLLLAAGCSRYIDSEDVDFKLPEEPSVPTFLDIVHLQDGLRLSWQVPETVAGTTYRVYSSDSLDGQYDLLETTSDLFLITDELTAGQVYFLKVSMVLPNGLEGRKSSAVSTRTGILSAVINDGAIYCISRDVTISFVVPLTAGLVQVSERSDFSGAFWETYAPTKDFTLSIGDGIKHIYARFLFSDGSHSDSTSPVTDSIIFDTEAMIDSVYFLPRNVVFTKGGNITFYLVASEADGNASVSFSGVSQYQLDFDEVASNPDAGRFVYSRSYIIPGGIEVNDGVVTGRFSDAAGNSAPQVRASTLLNISNQPLPVTLAVVAESSSRIRLNWSEAADNDFAAYQIYRSKSNTVSNDSEPIAVITSKTTLTYNDDGLDDSTRYYYRIYVYDRTGLSAGSTTVSAMTLVNAAPIPVTLAGRYETAVELSWTANQDDDFESYRLYRSVDSTLSIDLDSPLAIINGRAEAGFTDAPAAGQYFYKVAVFDAQGKWAMSNWVSILVPTR